MNKDDRIRRAGELRAQGLPLKVIAMRLGVSEGQASKLARAATRFPPEQDHHTATRA